ncbi:MAG: HyaD/HybD family hydrogenase maturation endopeptidase [Desulfurella sp.]|uniref:HyaD/HybD family hydrogenase maturation endopeptidase n=1 Tax=Desulfurella sp. TaxID=1962857 RepID=UPI003D0EFA2D
MNSIAVIGLGNTLLGDEGFGVHFVNKLKSKYTFSENVKIFDGGTIGFLLIEHFLENDKLIFIDAIRANDTPGSIYKFNVKELPPNITFVSSIHEIGLGDILGHVRLMGLEKETVVIGIEPLSVCPNNLTITLTPLMEEKMPSVEKLVLEQIKEFGGSYA